MEDIITEQEWKSYFDDMKKYHEEAEQKWASAKSELIGLIEPKYFDFAESHDTHESDGIVEIDIFIPTYTNYPNLKHCKEGGLTYILTNAEVECLDFESKYEGESVEYWVWQQTVFEDSYSGYLLLPLLDGKRFWKVAYSC